MPALRRWKEAPGRKPLLLTGVRQCGAFVVSLSSHATVLKLFFGV